MDPRGRVVNALSLTAGRADVVIPEAGFETIVVTSETADGAIDVVQGGDEIRVDGDTIDSIDTTTEHTGVSV